MSGHVVRIFLSSTFRDFSEERDLLVRKVFPSLRAKLQSRFVDLVDVDLRWGITEEEAERGEVLPICLSEIDRARPFFIGFLGERYGWVPPPDAYPTYVLESQSWLEEHRGGKSVTELEILHGVLNNPRMEERALFYFRSSEYSKSKGGDYIASSREDKARQVALKDTIRQSGFPVYEDYKSPEHLAELLEKDLWEILDREFPASDIPDAFIRERLQHEAYELPRQRLYINGDKYLTALDKALSEGKQWILVDGPSGGGKSALLANWLQSVRDSDNNIVVHAHYLGATADATDPVFLLRRMIECIKRKTESEDGLASDPDELLDSLPTWLAIASSWCEMHGRKFLFAIDALNGLSERRDLRWFPRMLPKHIHLVVSTLPGEVNYALQDKADWSHVSVMPLGVKTAELVFTSYLALFNKTLPDDLVAQVMAHELSVNPLFLLTLAEELRLFGEHEQLSKRLNNYLTSITVDDLFEQVLERIEQDFGAEMLRQIMTALWAARAGLREEEILGYSSLKPMRWAYIRNALGPTLIDASGRLIFAHDYMRIAVSDKYMAGNNTVGNEGQSEEALNLRRVAHKKLAQWFEERAFKDDQAIVSDMRAAEEIPFQWQQTQDWQKLQSTLTNKKMLLALAQSRSEEELLSYWLILEANIKIDIETQYEKAWKKWKLNEDEEATGDLAGIIGGFLRYAGRLKSFSLKLTALDLSAKEKFLGHKHPKFIKSLNNYGYFLKLIGRYEDATQIYERCLQLQKEVSGPEHADTAVLLINYATLVQEKGDPDSALELLKRSLEICEKTLGLWHARTATALNNIAVIHKQNGDFDPAETMFRRCLDINKKLFGLQHHRTAGSLNNLAALLKAQGNYAKSEELFRKSLKITSDTLGFEHALVSGRMSNLAKFLHDQEKYAAARPLFEECLRIDEKVYGSSHPNVARSLGNLAGLLRDTGEESAALSMLKKSLAIRKDILGSEHPDVAISMENLAASYLRVEDFSRAIKLLQQSLEVKKKIWGEKHPATAKTLFSLGEVYVRLQNYEIADQILTRCLKIREKILHQDHLDISKTLMSLSNLKKSMCDTTAAISLLNRAVRLQEAYFGDKHKALALPLNNLGVLYREERQFPTAMKFLHQAEAIIAVNQNASLVQASNFIALGNTYSICEQKEKAKSYFRAAIKIREQILGFDHELVNVLQQRLLKLENP